MMFLKNLWNNTEAIGWIGGLVSQYLGLCAFEIIGDLLIGVITGTWAGVITIVGGAYSTVTSMIEEIGDMITFMCT